MTIIQNMKQMKLTLEELLIPNPSGSLKINKNKILSVKNRNDQTIPSLIYNFLLKNDYYKIEVRDNFIVVVPKNLTNNFVILVSHLDNVYKKCFIKETEENYIGTFDNILGLYVSLNLTNKNYNNIIFCYTDCEETDMSGIRTLNKYIAKKFTNNYKYTYIVLDVTEENVNVSTTIENSNIDCVVNEDIIIIENDNCGYDESAYLLKNSNVKTCSICAVLKMCDENDNCHNKNGNYIKKENILKYYNNVKMIVERNL